MNNALHDFPPFAKNSYGRGLVYLALLDMQGLSGLCPLGTRALPPKVQARFARPDSDLLAVPTVQSVFHGGAALQRPVH